MKQGFTLAELLIVIVLVGLIAVIGARATVKILNANIDKTMKVQEKNVESAALMYLEDYCLSPIDNTYHCSLTRTITNGKVYYNGQINLSVLISNKYISNVSIRDEACTGYVNIVNNEATARLDCGDLY